MRNSLDSDDSPVIILFIFGIRCIIHGLAKHDLSLPEDDWPDTGD